MQQPREAKDRIIVALDMDLDHAVSMAQSLRLLVGYFKIGPKLIYSVGARQAVEAIAAVAGPDRVFLDGKIKDTHPVMGEAAAEIAKMPGVAMFNIHADSGIDGMKAVMANKGNKLVLAVTVLTTLQPVYVYRYYHQNAESAVMLLATDAATAGVPGLVCSAQEALMLKSTPETSHMILVTPGIRPIWSVKGAQVRVMTEYDAILAGSDYTVIGSPITNPPPEVGSPQKAVELITAEIERALQERKI